MRSYIPQFLNTGPYKELINAEGEEFENLQASIEDVLNQLFVETATWGLDAWDSFLGLETKKYDVTERRKIMTARLSSQPPFSHKNLLAVLGQLAEGAEINEYPDTYSFDVILKTKGTFKGAYLTQIMDYVDTMRPAHLDYKVIIDYLFSLAISVKTTLYQSSVLSKCGTLLCEDEPWEATSGRSFADLITLSKSSWPSSILPVVKESLTLLWTSGREWSERISQSTAKYFSTPYLRCGNVAVSEEVRT